MAENSEVFIGRGPYTATITLVPMFSAYTEPAALLTTPVLKSAIPICVNHLGDEPGDGGGYIFAGTASGPDHLSCASEVSGGVDRMENFLLHTRSKARWYEALLLT